MDSVVIDDEKSMEYSDKVGAFVTSEMAKNVMAIEDIDKYAKWDHGDTPNSIKLVWKDDAPAYLTKYNAIICSSCDSSASAYIVEQGRWAWTAGFSTDEVSNPVRATIGHIYHSIQLSVAKNLAGARSSNDMLGDADRFSLVRQNNMGRW